MNATSDVIEKGDQIDRLVLEDANAIRLRICRVSFLVMSVVSIPALAASLYRITDIGFQPVMFSHIVLTICIWLVTLQRNSISYRLQSRFLVLLYAFIGLAGIAQFGLMSGGISFIVVAAPLSAVFCGRREAIGVISCMIVASIVLAALFINGHLSYSFDLSEYVKSPIAWIVSLLALFITSSTLTAGLVVFNEGLFKTIASSKQQELALQTSEDRLNLVLEGSQLGFWDWNAVTNEVYFSHTWKEMLGYTEDEVGNDLSEWDKRVHPDDKEAVYADLNAHLEGKTPFYENEHRVLCKDGSYKWILDRGQVMSRTEDGKPLRVTGTHADITEKKEIELEKQRLTQELQTALNDVKVLSGLLPICSSCKNVRDDNGYWDKIETYISRHSDADFSHGICPDCAKKLYPDIDFDLS
jgi:PAS domain S-box-containing protein